MCHFLWGNGAASTIRTKNSSGETPMFAACECGHKNVAQWLFEVGAADDIFVEDGSHGCTPMFAACKAGQLDVVEWLLDSGASNDIRTKDCYGNTPMHAVCREGRLDVAMWLYKVGAADDIRSTNTDGWTPMYAAVEQQRFDVVQWIFHLGGLDIGAGIYSQQHLQRFFHPLHHVHAAFFSLVLPAVRFRTLLIPTFDAKAQTLAPSALALLRGHEETVLSLIADFCGVVRGWQLRHVREAAAANSAVLVAECTDV